MRGTEIGMERKEDETKEIRESRKKEEERKKEKEEDEN